MMLPPWPHTTQESTAITLVRQIGNGPVVFANSGVSAGKHFTKLPFEQLSKKAAQADTFQDFPTSLMNVGKTCDDGNISIFTGDGVTVHKEQDVLITCKGDPILIEVQDK